MATGEACFVPDDVLKDRGVSDSKASTEKVEPVRRIALAQLEPADSPRLSGEDERHARVLADTEARLPPIVVHAPTLRVIDGMHRVRAARMRGLSHIHVRLFDGSVEDAFVESVRLNVAHGKPLTTAEREAAAERILRSYSQWSDRAVADVCGISASTIAAIRRRATARIPQLDARIGKDGRVRPVDHSLGRRRAMNVLADDPNASLREVAKKARISPSTAGDVRTRLRNGVDPIRPEHGVAPVPSVGLSTWGGGANAQLKMLLEDTSLQSTECGRKIVELLSERFITSRDWIDIAGDLPRNRIYLIADLARLCARSWNEFADALEARAGRHR